MTKRCLGNVRLNAKLAQAGAHRAAGLFEVRRFVEFRFDFDQPEKPPCPMPKTNSRVARCGICLRIAMPLSGRGTTCSCLFLVRSLGSVIAFSFRSISGHCSEPISSRRQPVKGLAGQCAHNRFREWQAKWRRLPRRIVSVRAGLPPFAYWYRRPDCCRQAPRLLPSGRRPIATRGNGWRRQARFLWRWSKPGRRHWRGRAGKGQPMQGLPVVF